MIEITINEGAGFVGIKGHAGFAEAGQDIVCAGVSMLLFAFAEAERKAGGLYDLRTASGESVLHYRHSRAASRRLSVLRAGAELLAEKYPGNVRLVSWQGRKGTGENDMLKLTKEVSACT